MNKVLLPNMPSIDIISTDYRNTFSFYAPVRVFSGRGISNSLADQLVEHSWKRPMVITDKNVAQASGKKIIDQLLQASYEVIVWDKVHCEPSDSSLIPGIQAALDFKPDVIVGLGGGSSMDSAKVIAVAAKDGNTNVAEYLRPATRIIKDAIPLVTIPTTAGTGAEITRGVVITDEKKIVKRGFSYGGCYATFALIDPALTETMPSHITSSTGIDAFCHAIEAYMSPTPFPISDALALYALSLIKNNLDDAIHNQSEKARDAMSIASNLACLSFATGAGLTFSHLFSDVVGPRYNIPHGYASALVLPGTVALFERYLPERAIVLSSLLALPHYTTLLEGVRDVFRKANVPHISSFFSYEEARLLVDETFVLSFRCKSFNKEEAYEAVKVSFDIA